MYYELACYDRAATYDDLMKSAFVASRKAFDTICVPAGLVSKVADFILGPKISAAIDYPFGTDLTETRVASIVHAYRRGCHLIDLVINNVDLLSGAYDKVIEDVTACLRVCDAKKIGFRVILEYSLFDLKSLLDICLRLRLVGVNTVVTSSLSLNDDAIDSLITAEHIQKESRLNVIVSIQHFNHHITELCTSSGVYGMRVGAYRNIYLQALGDGV